MVEEGTHLDIRPSNYSSKLYYTSYLKIIILTVIFGSCSCGVGTYWEMVLLLKSSSTPHVYQLMFILAIIIGSLSAAFTLPYFGRRRPLIGHLLPIYPAYILNALYQGLHWCDLLSRFLSGIAIGGYLTSACIYMAEISLARSRGRNYALLFLGYWLGLTIYMFLYQLNPYFSIVILLFPTIFMFMACIYLPDTPYYVMQIDEKEFSAEILHFLRCGPLKFKEMEYLSIARFVHSYDRSFWSFSRKWQVIDRVGTSTLLMLFVNFSGFPIFILNIRMIGQFIPAIMTSNLTGSDSMHLTGYELLSFALITLVSLVGFFIYYLTIDKWKRKCLMFLSSSGTLLCLALQCAYYFLITIKINLSYLLYAATLFFFFSYFLGQAHLPFLLIGEIFPYNLKHAFCACGISLYFLFMALGYALTRTLILDFGPMCAALYFTVINLIGVLFMVVMVPEYRCYSLEAIQEYFDGIRPSALVDDFEIDVDKSK